LKPILLELGSFRLHSFGLLVALGFLAGSWIASRRGRAIGLDPQAIQDIVFPWLLMGGLIGARILYVLSYWQRDFAGQPLVEVLAIWKGGLVFYGGLIGATIAGAIGIRRKGLPLWATADCLAIGLALGHFFGRLACLLNGCCHGAFASRPVTPPVASGCTRPNCTRPLSTSCCAEVSSSGNPDARMAVDNSSPST